MSITKITAYCDTSDMGDETTEDDAHGYRDWLESELAKAFPGAEIDVRDEQSLRTADVETDGGIGDDMRAEELVCQYIEAAWDRCPWTWLAAQ